MPLMFLIAGILFFTAAVRGKEATAELVDTLKDDFTGPNNFFVWALAVGTVAGLGYVPKMKPLSNALFVLIIFAIILKGSKASGSVNFVTEFFRQIRATERATVL